MFSVKEATRPGPDRPLGSVPVGTTFLLQGSNSSFMRVSSTHKAEREGVVDVTCLDGGFIYCRGLLYPMPASSRVYLIDIEGSVTFVDE